MEARNKFYEMPLGYDAVELLQQKNFMQLPNAIDDDKAEFKIIIDREDQRFWIVCSNILSKTRETASIAYREQIKTTTLKEITTWLN